MVEIPKYPDDGRDCHSIDEAVELLLEIGLTPVNEARISYFPEQDCFSYYFNRGREVLSYAFFNELGREIGSFTPFMKRFTFHSGSDGKGRVWGDPYRRTTCEASIVGNIEYARRKLEEKRRLDPASENESWADTCEVEERYLGKEKN